MKRRMNVVSFNLRYGAADDGPNHWNLRKDVLLDVIALLEPDILGVQECLPFQADEVKQRFPAFDHFGLGRYHAVACDRIKEHLSGEHCSIFYRTDRFRLLEAETFWHSDTPEVSGSRSWGNNLPRITTWGRLQPLEAQQPFCVFNTHLHWDEPYVSTAVELLRSRMAEVAGQGPLVLTGDFNAVPGSAVHDVLTRGDPGAFRLGDVWNLLGMPEQGSGTGHGFTGVPDDRIDWILVTPHFRPLSVERYTGAPGGRYPSDHFPLKAVVELDRG